MTAPMIAAPIPLPVSFGTTTAAATPTTMWAAVLVAPVGLMVTASLLAQAAGPGCHSQAPKNRLTASPYKYPLPDDHLPYLGLAGFV